MTFRRLSVALPKVPGLDRLKAEPTCVPLQAHAAAGTGKKRRTTRDAST